MTTSTFTWRKFSGSYRLYLGTLHFGTITHVGVRCFTVEDSDGELRTFTALNEAKAFTVAQATTAAKIGGYTIK